jgi:cell wall-associated NlpC family hydrolase
MKIFTRNDTRDGCDAYGTSATGHAQARAIAMVMVSLCLALLNACATDSRSTNESVAVVPESVVAARSSTYEAAPQSTPRAAPDATPKVTPDAPRERDRASEVLVYALSLVGVKYQFGGNSAATGFDCSGFVHHVFGEIANVVLPRSAEAMAQRGAVVAREDLTSGDLVFYNTRSRANSHVGIYLGNNTFVHSPSRGKSVEVVDMTENYWRKRFNGARRLLSGNNMASLSANAQTLAPKTVPGKHALIKERAVVKEPDAMLIVNGQ